MKKIMVMLIALLVSSLSISASDWIFRYTLTVKPRFEANWGEPMINGKSQTIRYIDGRIVADASLSATPIVGSIKDTVRKFDIYLSNPDNFKEYKVLEKPHRGLRGRISYLKMRKGTEIYQYQSIVQVPSEGIEYIMTILCNDLDALNKLRHEVRLGVNKESPDYADGDKTMIYEE